MKTLLKLSNLSVDFPTRFGTLRAIDGIDMEVMPGEIVGLVGESGAGKSTIGSAIMGLTPLPGFISSGTIELNGTDLSKLDDTAYHRLRGAQISMIFQDPQTSLNPLLTIESQLVETIQQHSDVSYADARQQAVDLLVEMEIDDAEERLSQYPHQFSGGMRQRVVIALAICTNPELIIADEPTTALDVSVQKEVLRLIRNLAKSRKVGIVLITHDMGVIAQITDRILVLRGGRMMETGKTADILSNPQNAYTKSLLAAVPRLGKRLKRFTNIDVQEGQAQNSDANWSVPSASAEYASNWLRERLETQEHSSDTILSVHGLSVDFIGKRTSLFGKKSSFRALDKVELQMARGEVLGIIGESGSGKSTLAKTIVGLVPPSEGHIEFNGDVLPVGRARSRHHPVRRELQMVFQDPYSSLNSRRQVLDIIGDPIRHFGLAKNDAEIRKIVASMLELVEMPQRAMLRYPHQFSGGQRQRIAVARALVTKPRLLICDEPTSALDVSVQAQILNLIKDLQEAFGLSVLFISHNLGVVRQMSDKVAVLQKGKIIETGNADAFFAAPQHAYSQKLLADTPTVDDYSKSFD